MYCTQNLKLYSISVYRIRTDDGVQCCPNLYISFSGIKLVTLINKRLNKKIKLSTSKMHQHCQLKSKCFSNMVETAVYVFKRLI